MRPLQTTNVVRGLGTVLAWCCPACGLSQGPHGNPYEMKD